MAVVTCFVICGSVYVWVFVVSISFGNMFTCIYCVCIVSIMCMFSYLFRP
jgi:hypothetical protein